MIRAQVRANGTLDLGEEAAAVGFGPGAVVDIIVTCAGSVILALDDSPPLDVGFRPLVGGAAQLAIRQEHDRGRPR